MTLPQVPDKTAYAAAGTVVHEYLSAAVHGNAVKALESVPTEHRQACSDIDLESLPPAAKKTCMPEMAMAYDAATGMSRLIGYNIGRNYGKTAETEITMSCDLAGVDEQGLHGYVYDYKTGFGYVPEPKNNAQLKVAALALYRLRNLEAVTVGLIFVQPGMPVRTHEHTFTGFDLDLFAADLEHLAKQIARPNPPMATGEHCKYCPAAPNCPAQRALVKTATNLDLSNITPADVPEIWEKLAIASGAIKKAYGVCFAIARQQPIELKNGNILGEVETVREGFEPEIAWGVIAEKYGSEVARHAASIEITKAGLKRALRPVAELRGIPFAQIEREAMDAIRQAGGTGFDTKVDVKEHK